MLNAFFAYGTLKREQCRGHAWPGTPVSVMQAWLRGELFSRQDYPAMCPGNDRVLGELWTFDDAQVASVLTVIDAIEGTNGNRPSDLYHRVAGEVFDLDGGSIGQAWTYHYVSDPIADGFVRLLPTDPDGYVAWPTSA